MIFHTIYTITIGKFAEMMETGDLNRCKRVNIWLPKKIVSKGYTKLIKQFNESSNKEGTDRKEKEQVNDGFDRLSVDYKLMWFQAMEKMIQIWYQTFDKQVRKDIDELFKAKYGKTPTEEDFLRIPKDHKLLIEKAQQVFTTPEENKKVDFEANVISLENALAPITIRDKKLYLFNKYIDLALKKVKKE
jgi:hypothetical protein